MKFQDNGVVTSLYFSHAYILSTYNLYAYLLYIKHIYIRYITKDNNKQHLENNQYF